MNKLTASLLCVVVLLMGACASGTDADAIDMSTPDSTASAIVNTLENYVEDKNNFKDFIPAGFSLLDSATGDLNLDAYPDLLLVLKSDAEDTLEAGEKEMARPLIILLGQQDGSYKLGGRSDNVVLCGGCGGVNGDAYMGLAIKDGYFSAEHYGGSVWRWTLVITFKYNKDDGKWYLYKEGGDSFNFEEPDKVETKVKTTKDFGVVLFEDYKGDY